MLTIIYNIVSAIFIFLGLFFVIAGTIGLIRFPDVFTRMHATGKLDTLGVGLILTGLLIYQGISLTSVKLLLLIIFIFIANPVATHAVAKIAYRESLKRWRRE